MNYFRPIRGPDKGCSTVFSSSYVVGDAHSAGICAPGDVEKDLAATPVTIESEFGPHSLARRLLVSGCQVRSPEAEIETLGFR